MKNDRQKEFGSIKITMLTGRKEEKCFEMPFLKRRMEEEYMWRGKRKEWFEVTVNFRGEDNMAGIYSSFSCAYDHHPIWRRVKPYSTLALAFVTKSMRSMCVRFDSLRSDGILHLYLVITIEEFFG